MSQLEMVLADSLIDAALVADVLADVKLEGFAVLAALGQIRQHAAAHPERLPAWQAWPLRGQAQVDVAAGWAAHFNFVPLEGSHQYLLQPVHLQVGTRGLVLSAPDQLVISDEESLDLLDCIGPLLMEHQLSIQRGDARHWLLTTPAAFVLGAAVPELAMHQDLVAFQPEGPAARAWRKLANQIQMLWHDHPVNEARQERALEPINAVWLSGDALAGAPQPLPYQRVTDAPAWLKAWPCDPHARSGLRLIDRLVRVAGEEDWRAWREALCIIDHDLLQQLDALRAGHITHLSVCFTGGPWVREVSVRRFDRFKFWRRGDALALFKRPA